MSILLNSEIDESSLPFPINQLPLELKEVFMEQPLLKVRQHLQQVEELTSRGGEEGE